MKKFILFALLSITPIISAATKNDLEKAIRDLDATIVKQIVASEKFSKEEYDRYFSLAEEVAHVREELFLYWYTDYDVTTPYEGPSLVKIALEWLGWEISTDMVSGMSSLLKSHEIGQEYVSNIQKINEKYPSLPKTEAKNDNIILEPQLSQMKTTKSLVATAVLVLSCKILYDCIQAKRMWDKRKEILRKKYDDAVTIKQLMYTANIAD